MRYCPVVFSALCFVVVVSGNDDGQCTMETKETCSEDPSAGKTSEESEQNTITIPASEDTETCTKDSCDSNAQSKNVIPDQSGEDIPSKDGKSSGEKEENSNTKGIERWTDHFFVSPEVRFADDLTSCEFCDNSSFHSGRTEIVV